jgi:hypothetical protein
MLSSQITLNFQNFLNIITFILNFFIFLFFFDISFVCNCACLFSGGGGGRGAAWPAWFLASQSVMAHVRPAGGPRLVYK